MWKPKPGTIYRDTEEGMTINVLEVPDTSGVPTHISENKKVKVKIGGLPNVISLIWFDKRKDDLEIVE